MESGEVFRVFDQQDSGCVSYGARRDSGAWFVKTSTTARATESLRSAVAVHTRVRHRNVIPLLNVVEMPSGPALVYPWFDGELLYRSTARHFTDRAEPASPIARVRRLPVSVVEALVAEILDAHLTITAAGLVAVDFYDGCIMYDFTTGDVRLCDLDEYRPGPFVAHRRLPGSTRFMAPEEYGNDQVIDQRTTVFDLGRAIRQLLDTSDTESAWRGNPEQLAVLDRATCAAPAARFPTVDALVAAWKSSPTRR